MVIFIHLPYNKTSSHIGDVGFLDSDTNRRKTKKLIPRNFINPPRLLANQNFLNLLGKLESNNNYTSINRYGYIGRYQFGKAALMDLGLVIDLDLFKENPHLEFPPELQDYACLHLLKINKNILSKHIEYNLDSIYKDIKITKAGILASAHLVGPGNVMKFLNSRGDIDPIDGNGVSVSVYMEKFKDVTIKI